MEDAAEINRNVTEDEVAALARVAGLAVPPERLVPLTGELNGTLAIVAELATVPPGDMMTALEPFDPAWETGTARR